MTLEEKVRTLIRQDDLGEGMVGRCSQDPKHVAVTDFEADLRVWGIVYGVAFGLARTEEPCETIEAVAERAYAAARPVFFEYTHGYSKRPERDLLQQDKLVEAVLREYRKIGTPDDPGDLHPLFDAIVALEAVD